MCYFCFTFLKNSGISKPLFIQIIYTLIHIIIVLLIIKIAYTLKLDLFIVIVIITVYIIEIRVLTVITIQVHLYSINTVLL